MTAAPEADDGLSWAMAYAALGIRVVPIPAGQKYPSGLKRWQDEATTDVDTLVRWWDATWPDAGVGLALGPVGDRWVFAVDIDGAGHGADGHAVWADLEAQHGKAPDTWVSITGGGGEHRFFWAPIEVTNANELPDGIDIRGAGGQVVVEPSVHPSGTRYQWEDGASPWDLKLARAPDWLLAYLELAPAQPRDPNPVPDGWASADRPGDLWAAATSWDKLLTDAGWTKARRDSRQGESFWTRPGKDKRDGCSATVGYGDADVLKVFTSSVPGLKADATYTKLGFYTAMNHGGDYAAAAQGLAAQGFAVTPEELNLAGVSIFDRPAEPQADPVDVVPDPIPPTADVDPDWPDPRPIPRAKAPPAWPTDVLPAWMQDHVANVARAVQCPPDLPGMYALGALSVVAIGHVDIRIRAGHQEPLTVWLVTPAPPAEGKSPALSMAMAPVRAIEREQMGKAARVVAEDAAQREALEQQTRKLQQALATAEQADQQGILAQIADLAGQLADMKHPSAGRLTTSDATPEKLAALMQSNGEALSIVSDEAGALAFDRYAANRARNLDIYLQSWSGQPVRVDRVTAPSVELDRPVLSIVVGAQPEAWQSALDDDEFRTRGLGARFMSATPVPIGLHRDMDLDRDEFDDDVAEAYHSRLVALGQLLAPHGRHGAPTAVLKLSMDARRAWKGWATTYRDRRQEGGDLEDDAAWVSKMQDTVLRVAGLLHLADGGALDDDVPLDCLQRAQRLGDYWAGHRKADTMDQAHVPMRLLRILARIQTDGQVTKSTLKQRGSKGMRTSEEVHEHIELLAEYGWLKVGWPGAPVGRAGWWRIPGWWVRLHPRIVDHLAAGRLPTATHHTHLMSPSVVTGDDPSTNEGLKGQAVYRPSFDPDSPSDQASGDTPHLEPFSPGASEETDIFDMTDDAFQANLFEDD